MQNFTVTIRLGNAAMQTPDDVADALDKVAQRLRSGAGGDPFEPFAPVAAADGNEVNLVSVFDVNGNIVGSANVSTA